MSITTIIKRAFVRGMVYELIFTTDPQGFSIIEKYPDGEALNSSFYDVHAVEHAVDDYRELISPPKPDDPREIGACELNDGSSMRMYIVIVNGEPSYQIRQTWPDEVARTDSWPLFHGDRANAEWHARIGEAGGVK